LVMFMWSLIVVEPDQVEVDTNSYGTGRLLLQS